MLASPDERTKELLGVWLPVNKVTSLLLREDEVASVRRLHPALHDRTGRQGLTFLNHQMRIIECASIEQIGRECGMQRFLRLAVDVGIAEQALLHPHIFLPAEPDNDNVYMGLAARVRAPAKVRCAKSISNLYSSKRRGQRRATCSPCVIEFVDTNPIRVSFPAT